MRDEMRDELIEHFQRTVGMPPVGARERVLTGLRASAERPGSRRLEWAASAVAVALALLAVAALVLSRLGPQPQPARQQEVPSPRTGAAVVYDARRHVVVLFGGADANGRPVDGMWTWDGRRWTRAHPPASPRGVRPGAPMAYDAASGTLVLYDGPGSTWTWDGRTWSDHRTPGPAGEPGLQAMAYDPATGTVLLHITSSDIRTHQTWSWDGDAWTQLHPETEADVVDGAMAFDGQRLLLVGSPSGVVGGQAVTETWAWDGRTWTLRAPAVRLPVSNSYALAYDEGHRRLVAVVSPEGLGAAETWTWDGVTWSRERPAHLPAARFGAALAYDPAARAVLLFGGLDARSIALAETWTWDGSDWTLRKEATR